MKRSNGGIQYPTKKKKKNWNYGIQWSCDLFVKKYRSIGKNRWKDVLTDCQNKLDGNEIATCIVRISSSDTIYACGLLIFWITRVGFDRIRIIWSTMDTVNTGNFGCGEGGGKTLGNFNTVNAGGDLEMIHRPLQRISHVSYASRANSTHCGIDTVLDGRGGRHRSTMRVIIYGGNYATRTRIP